MTIHESSSSPSSKLLEPFDGILFDLDGVITPTAEFHEKAWRETFEEVLPILAQPGEQTYRLDDYRLHIDGRSRFDGVRALLEAHGVELPWGKPADAPGVDSVCAIGNKKNAVFTSLLQREPIGPYPGSLKLLERLADEAKLVALVSSSANAAAVLESAGLSDSFDVVVEGRLIARLGLAGKPKPDPYLEAARRLDLSPGSCVVIEDAITGVEAGRAGGFGLVVGVVRDGDREGLLEAGADVVVSDLGELL